MGSDGQGLIQRDGPQTIETGPDANVVDAKTSRTKLTWGANVGIFNFEGDELVVSYVGGTDDEKDRPDSFQDDISKRIVWRFTRVP